MTFTCTVCNKDCHSKNELHKHRWVEHQLKREYNRNPKIQPISGNPAMDKLRELKLQTTAALKDLEAERDCMHRKLLELDNTISAYKKAIV